LSDFINTDLTLGSLFSGIGGFEYAASQVGIKPIWSNELDPYCCRVLRKNFTHEIIEKDIKQISNLPYVDIVSGGFPCQGFSNAGKRKGTNDDRYLWQEMLTVVEQVRPDWVVAENVTGILSMVDESDIRTEVFAKVEGSSIVRYDEIDHYEGIYTRQAAMLISNICESLEKANYQVQAFAIPACSLRAWHRRERIWIVAHNDNLRHKQKLPIQARNEGKEIITIRSGENVSNTNGTRCSKLNAPDFSDKSGQHTRAFVEGWEYWATEPRMGGMVARLSGRMDRTINWFFISHLCIFAYVKLNGKASKENGIEILRTLRCGISQGQVQWEVAGFKGIQKKEILLTYLRQLEEKEFEQEWLSLESQETSEKELRELWLAQESACSPHRSQSQKQPTGKFTNTLHLLSQILARHAREAWIENSGKNAVNGYWDNEPEGIPRVANKIPKRVDRLKGLGNAIVPQIAFEIFKAIIASNQ